MVDTRSRPANRGDVVINGKKYPLFDDPKRGLAWWREGGMDIQEGSAAKEVAAIWDRGWRGGMGETKRLAPDSMGYAYSVNMDCTPDGYARLSSMRTTVSPTNAPPDAKTHFHLARAAGTAVYAVGSVVKSTTAGTTSQNVTHTLSVAPKAIICWTTGKTASGTVGAGTYNSFGFTDGTTSRCASWNSDDNVATTNAARRWASALVSLIDASGSANQPEATVSAVGATTFTLDWTNNDANAVIIHFMVIGGTDVSASVDQWATGTTNTTVAVTGVGFKPDLLFHLTSSSSALGTAADALAAIAAVDAAGNMATVSIGVVDNKAAPTSQVVSLHAATGLEPVIVSGGSYELDYGSYHASMDADGFSTRFALTPSNNLVATLSLKGLRAKVGAFTKRTSTGDQAALSIGYATTAFFLFSDLDNAGSGQSVNATLAIGAASSTTAVEASAWMDEGNVNPTDNYGLDDTALAFEKIDATGAENATATCGNIDMEQTGWLNWATNDAATTEIAFVAFAALSESTASSFVYCHAGQRTYKMSVASDNSITVANEKDWGGNVTVGKPDQFESLWYLPAGGSVVFQELTTIAASGADTWTAAGAGLFATAFCGSQDGATAKLLRARPTNLVDLAATAPRTAGSWADDFEVGDSSSAVVEAVDTGVVQYVSKTDGLYKFAIPGIATKVPVTTTVDSDGGVGLIAVQGTEVCFVSYPSGLWCIDGEHVRAIGPDTIRSNEAIPNVTLEPFRGRHYENAMFGRWLYSLYRVTESGTTRTYIMAGYIHRLGAQPVIEWHTPFAESGAARGLGIFEVNDKVTLWTQVGGVIVYRVLGQDGSPNAGRDAIGYGAASTQHQLFLPLTDSGLPHTTKQSRVLEVKTRNLNANCPVQLQISRDGAALANVGATVTSDGVSKRYWTLGSSDTARDAMVVIDITTGASYAPATDDPQIWGVVHRSVPTPDHAGVYTVIIDTGERYKDGAQPPESVKKMRDDLITLTTSSAVACVDPDTNSIDMKILEVKDVAVMQNAIGAVKYVLELTLEEFVNA